MGIFPLIDKRAPFLNRLLKLRLLPASTEEVYFVPPGGHIDQNRSDKNESPTHSYNYWRFKRLRF